MGEPSRNRPALSTAQQQQQQSQSQTQQSSTIIAQPTTDLTLPPDYSTVFTDPAAGCEIGPRILYNSYTHRQSPNINERNTVSSNGTESITVTTPSHVNTRILTGNDVVQLLRPIGRSIKSHRTSSLGSSVDHILRTNLSTGLSRSVENLVLNAEPMDQSSTVVGSNSSSNGNEENVSVI